MDDIAPDGEAAISRRALLAAAGATALTGVLAAVWRDKAEATPVPTTSDDHLMAAWLARSQPFIPRRAAAYRISRPLRIAAGRTVTLEPGTEIVWQGAAGTSMGDLIGVFEAAGDDTAVIVAEGGVATVSCARPSPLVYAAAMRGQSGFRVIGLRALECQHVLVDGADDRYSRIQTSRPGANIARDVLVEGGGARFSRIPSEGHGACLLRFVRGVQLRDATYAKVPHGVQWWGGDANPGSGEGPAGQERKCGELLIERVTVRDAGGGAVWGSMGRNVTVRDCLAERSGDVGFDAEGSDAISFERCTSRDARNGCFTTFFLCNGVRFVDCVGTVSNRAFPLLRVYNSSQSNRDNRGLAVLGGRFECLDPAGPGTIDTAMGPVQTITVQGAQLTNVVIDLAHFNMHRTEVSGNQLSFAVAPRSFSAITVGSSKSLAGPQGPTPGAALVANNTIRLLAAPPPGGEAVAITLREDDFNSAATGVVSDNRVEGPFTTGILLANASLNSGIRPSVLVSGNEFAKLAPDAALVRTTRERAGPAPLIRWGAPQLRDGRPLPREPAGGR